MTQPPRKPTDLTPDYQRDWPLYFENVKDKPPRETTLLALKHFASLPPSSRTALDIGCGEGRDTRAILAAGDWQVFATDSHPEAIARTRAGLTPHESARCTTLQASMESLSADPRLPQRVDLVNASFALPFCNPDHFPTLWTWIVSILVPGGRFSGQLFGDRDEWATVRPASHRTRAQIELLLAPFTIESLEEVEKLGEDAMGGTKFHHVFHIVARRNA